MNAYMRWLRLVLSVLVVFPCLVMLPLSGMFFLLLFLVTSVVPVVASVVSGVLGKLGLVRVRCIVVEVLSRVDGLKRITFRVGSVNP